MKNIIVTGGAGFIGTNLCEYLVTKDYNISVVDNLSAGMRERLPEQVAFFEQDIRDTSALAELFAGHDAVVHLAALPSVQFSIDNPLEAHDHNVNGTLSVLEAAKAVGVKRIVFASSAAVYGDQEVLPLGTQLRAQPKSPYALHKYEGECLMRLWSQLYDLETVSLRFFNVYGPHLDPTGPYALVVGKFLELMQAHKPLTITGTGEQTRDFIHTTDIARAIECALTTTNARSGEVFNIGSGVQTSINTLARLFGGEIEYVPPRIEPMHSVADISNTVEKLGWEPAVAMTDGIVELKRQFNLA